MGNVIMQVSSYYQAPVSAAGISSNAAANRTVGMAVSVGDSSQSSSPTSDASTILQGINYIQDQLKDLQYSNPPFFPVGHPQRLALIKRIRDLQDSIKTYSDNNNNQVTPGGNKLPKNANDAEISKALDHLYTAGDILSKNRQLSAAQTRPGSLVNIKV